MKFAITLYDVVSVTVAGAPRAGLHVTPMTLVSSFTHIKADTYNIKQSIWGQTHNNKSCYYITKIIGLNLPLVPLKKKKK